MLAFFLAGIGGNVMSCVMFPGAISVGASSSLFGCMVLYGYYLWENYDQLGENKNTRILIFGFIILANLGISADENKSIDMGAHFGIF